MQILFRILPLILILSIPDSSEKRKESDLVRRLEAIFYDPAFARIPDRHFPVSEYGATGDGITLNTEAIQRTIDAASAAGGGVVTFPRGVYLSGAIFVKSNVELRIDEGVVLMAVQDDSAFPDIWTRVAGIEMYWPAALVNIYQEKNVRITGKGVIDGNGKYWWDKFWGDPPRSGGMWTGYNARGIRWAVDYDCKRVRALVVYDSEDVLLKDFTVKRSGFWTVTMTYCSRVHVDGVVIRNNIGGFGPSSDGINTDSSSDILVEYCDIDCNDDNLCIKAGRDADGLRVNRPSKNIVYRNSVTRAGHGLFTLGSETSGGMENIEVYGLKAEGTSTGIRFKSAKVRGGVIKDIWFHDIEMKRVANPFHFELDWYSAYSYPHIPEDFPPDSIPGHWKVLTLPVTPAEKGIPEFSRLKFSRISAVQANTAFHVNAFQEKPMRDLIWEDIRIEAEKAGFINHARDWTMQNVTLTTPSGGRIELKDCINVQVPDYVSRQEGGTDETDESVDFNALLGMKKQNMQLSRISAVSDRNRLIGSDDTLYSEVIRVMILPGEDGELTFFEPLGDGFYVVPVTIKVGPQKSLTVAGERNHRWIFFMDMEYPPAEVRGADEWHYHPEQNWLEVKREGTSFEIRTGRRSRQPIGG